MTPLNEPSMEDILASIRRIIAEDQSQGLARNGLTGLTRRREPAEAPTEAKAPAPEVDTAAPAPAATADAVLVEQEVDLHDVSQADILHDSYDTSVAAAEAAEPHPGTAFPPMQADSYHPAAPEGDAVEALPAAFQAHQDAPLASPEAEPLISPVAGASITSSFQALAESVVFQDPGLVERIMRETMRPLLKEWLDDHLPSIVERLVRAEIERVARGGRSH